MDLIDSKAFFTYLHDPIISALRPTSGPLRGGTVLSILGSGFRETGVLMCAFDLGNTSFSVASNGLIVDPSSYFTFVSAQWISSTEIKCQTPPSESPGEVRVSVSFNGGSDVVSLEWEEQSSLENKITFLYYEDCKISSVEPTEEIWPGQNIVVHGEGFLHSGSLSIHFGGFEASNIQYISSEKLICIAPELPQWFQSTEYSYSNGTGVFVRNNRLDPCISNVTVIYADPAEGGTNYYDAHIDSMIPSHGTVSGGTLLKMYGKGLQPGHPCVFGGIMSPSLSASLEQEDDMQHEYETAITCTAPAARHKLSGVVSVAVGGVGGSNYTYVDDIIVSSMVPLVGPATGGTIISIFGYGFSDVPGLMCSFNDKLIAAKWISSSTVQCISPPRTSVVETGKVSISLVYGQGGEHYYPVDESQKFGYHEVCYTHKIVPSEGMLSGGTQIVVIGENFLPLVPLLVRFGSPLREVPASYINSTALLCNSPPALEGDDDGLYGVQVVVSMNGGSDFCIGEMQFVYGKHSPNALSFHPSCGPFKGGTEVTVLGEDFVHPLQCFFDFNMATEEDYTTDLVFAAEATVLSPSELICQSPAAPCTNATASVYVAFSEGKANTPPVGIFHYYSSLIITSASPLSGPSSGSTTIIISGEGFVDSINTTCRFVFPEYSSALQDVAATEITVEASVLSSRLLRCSTPPVTHAETALLYVNPDTKVDDDGPLTPIKFQFYEECSVSGVFPDFLPNPFWGDTDIIIKGNGFVLSANLLAFFGSYSFGIPLQFINSTTLRVSPPKAVFDGSEGFLEVHVSNNGGGNFCQVEEENIHINFSPDHTFNTTIDHTLTSGISISIESASPLLGPLSGGTNVFLNGRGVSLLSGGDLVCRFGWTTFNSSATFASVKTSANSETFCITPPAPGLLSTSVQVAVFISGSSTPIHVFVFSYLPVPSALTVFPSFGPTTGGTLLSIQGGGFFVAHTSIENIICVFSRETDVEGDDIAVQATSIGTLNSPNDVQCEAPPLTEGSTFVHISLSTDFEFLDIDRQQNLLLGHTRGDAVLYEYYTPPSVLDLDPLFGYMGGGYQIRVLGEGFLPSVSLSVRFYSTKGSIVVKGNYLSQSEILCVVPSLPSGSFMISVSNNGHDFVNYDESLSLGEANVEFKSLSEDMKVISSTPRFGPVAGSSTVIITGLNLLSNTQGDLFCRFGEEKVVAIPVNDTAVSCISPPAPGGGPIDASISLIREIGFKTSIIPGELIYFSYIDPVVLAVQPLWGPTYGGTTVRVVGQGFPSGPHPSIRCSFGLTGFTPAVWISEEILLCTSPPSPFGINTKQEVELSVHFSPEGISSTHHITRYNSAGYISNVTAVATASVNGFVLLPRFTYVEPCINVDIYPKFGPSLGGTQVVVTGMFFEHASHLSVWFGTRDVSAEWLNETALLCISPASALPGDVEIGVHYGNIIGSEAIMSCDRNENVTFTYIGYNAAESQDGNNTITSSVPMVTGIFPSWGPSLGGTEITVFGFGFAERDSILCVFGNTPSASNSTWVDSTKFRCITPHSTSTIANQEEHFSVSWLPAASDVAAKPISIYSEIEVIQFEFLNNCQPYDMWPKSALTSGGSELLVFGTGFPADDTHTRSLSVVFVFGDTLMAYTAEWRLEVAASMVNSTTLQCTLPSSPLPGTAAVYIAVGCVELCHAGNFTFLEGGYVDDSAVSPAFSSILGNGSVYVKGKGFQKDAECIFGVPLENGTVAVMGEPLLDGSGLMCHVPPVEQPGTVRLGISGALGTTPFTYVPAPTVLSVLPSSGLPEGGNTLRVSGTGFLPTDTILCLFTYHGTTISVSSFATRLSSSLVICESVPQGVGGSTVSVDLKLNGVDLGANVPYFYQPVISICNIFPPIGLVTGGTIVTVEGVGFIEDKEWWCWFGTVKVPARITRVIGNESSDPNECSTSIQCISPPLSQRTQSVFVSVSMGDSLPVGLQQQPSIQPTTLEVDNIQGEDLHYFTYIDVEETEPAWPISGSVNGGTNVVVQLIRNNAIIDLAASLTEEFECTFKTKGGIFEVASLATSDHEKNSFICTVPPLSSFNLSQSSSPSKSMIATFDIRGLVSKAVVVQHLSFTYTLDLRVASASIAFSVAAAAAASSSTTDTVLDIPSNNVIMHVIVMTGSGFLNGPHLCCKILGRRDKKDPITVIVAANWISEFEIHCNVNVTSLESHKLSSDSFSVTSVGISNNGVDFTVVPFTTTQTGDGDSTIFPPVLPVVRPIIFGIDISSTDLLNEPPYVVQVAWITTGGGDIILFGKHFFLLHPPIACIYHFADSDSFPVNGMVLEDSHVLCHIPVDIPSGTAEIQLRDGDGGGSSSFSSGNVTVIISPLPALDTVYPNVGRAAGGEIIRLGGNNMCPLPPPIVVEQSIGYEEYELALKRVTPMCRFGDGNMVKAISVAQDCTWVECLSPPLHSTSLSRTIEVSVSLGPSTHHYLPPGLHFTYVDRPYLRAASPRFAASASLPGSAWNIFNLIGSGFATGMQCIFEFGFEIESNKSMKVPSVSTVLTSTRAFCRAPLQSSPGMATMWLLSAAGEQSVESLPVFFLQESEISAELTLHPKHGPLLGGNILSIRVVDSLLDLNDSHHSLMGWSTRNFFSAAQSSPSAIECRFGHMRVPAILVGEWTIHCTVPSNAVNEVVTVCVALTSAQVCTETLKALAMTYHKPCAPAFFLSPSPRYRPV